MRRNRSSSVLRAAGLSTALAEQGLVRPCKQEHSIFYDRGYAFCPHCGVKIEQIRNCPTCGKRFFSETAFKAHVIHGVTKKVRYASKITPESAYALGYRYGYSGTPGKSAKATYKDAATDNAYSDGYRVGQNDRRTDKAAKQNEKQTIQRSDNV